MCACDFNGPRHGTHAQISRFDGCNGPDINLRQKKKRKTCATTNDDKEVGSVARSLDRGESIRRDGIEHKYNDNPIGQWFPNFFISRIPDNKNK